MAALRLTLPLHSVIFTIGVNRCGKSTFCRDRLRPKLIAHLASHGIPNPRVIYLSSNEDTPQSHEMIQNQLYTWMAYPRQTHYIIVDAHGLSLDFLRQMKPIVESQAYTMASLTWLLRDNSALEDVNQLEQASYLHDTMFKALCKCFSVQNRISSFEQAMDAPLTFVIDSLHDYAASFLPVDREYLIIGDTHECVDDLKNLLTAADYQIDTTQGDWILSSSRQQPRRDIVLVGDYLDKGGATRSMVEFLHRNMFLSEDERSNERSVTLHIVRGNHEMANFNLLTKYDTWLRTYGIEHVTRFYTASATLRSEPDLATKFLDLYHASRAFVAYVTPEDDTKSSRPFFVTHAPCPVKFVGKLDERSQRKQTYTYMRRDIPLARQLAKLVAVNYADAPLQVTGHVNLADVYMGYLRDHNYWVGIDTGCVVGGKLSGVLLGVLRTEAQIIQVESTRPSAMAEKDTLEQVDTLVARI